MACEDILTFRLYAVSVDAGGELPSSADEIEQQLHLVVAY